MIYFDNAATGGVKPDGVLNATAAALKTCANPGRSGHRLSLACMQRVYEARKLLCSYFNGWSYDRTVFTKNCTEALNYAILGGLSPSDEVVTTVAEHNSVLRPLEYLKKKGLKAVYAPLDGKKHIDIRSVCAYVTPKTRALIITLASNVTGAAPDIYAVRKYIPPQVLLICDGAQACGHVKVDMRRAGIDALCVAGHKGMHAVQGAGALLFSERFDIKPVLFGGTGSESFNADMPSFYPDALEAGTLNYPAVCSLAEGVLYLNERGAADAEKLAFLCRYLHDGLKGIKGVTLASEPNPYGIVAFSISGIQSEEAAYILSEKYSVCVRAGLHCAPLMHAALGSEGLVRASLSAFNSKKECDVFVNAISDISGGCKKV